MRITIELISKIQLEPVHFQPPLAPSPYPPAFQPPPSVDTSQKILSIWSRVITSHLKKGSMGSCFALGHLGKF